MTPGLIERLEAAGGGSHGLDADIYEALGFEVKRRPEWYGGRRYSRGWAFLRNSRWEAMAHLTVSLDDGLALAKRAGWRLYQLDASIISRSSVMLQSVDDRPSVDPDSGATLMGKDFAVGSGKTPALALCIAILKARATQEQG